MVASTRGWEGKIKNHGKDQREVIVKSVESARKKGRTESSLDKGTHVKKKREAGAGARDWALVFKNQNSQGISGGKNSVGQEKKKGGSGGYKRLLR